MNWKIRVAPALALFFSFLLSGCQPVDETPAHKPTLEEAATVYDDALGALATTRTMYYDGTTYWTVNPEETINYSIPAAEYGAASYTYTLEYKGYKGSKYTFRGTTKWAGSDSTPSLVINGSLSVSGGKVSTIEFIKFPYSIYSLKEGPMTGKILFDDKYLYDPVANTVSD